MPPCSWLSVGIGQLDIFVLACKQFLVFWILTLRCLAICSWLCMTLSALILVCITCLLMSVTKWSSHAVPTWQWPPRFLFYTCLLAWTLCWVSHAVAQCDTASCPPVPCMVTPSASHASACPLSVLLSFHVRGMALWCGCVSSFSFLFLLWTGLQSIISPATTSVI